MYQNQSTIRCFSRDTSASANIFDVMFILCAHSEVLRIATNAAIVIITMMIMNMMMMPPDSTLFGRSHFVHMKYNGRPMRCIPR